MDISGIANLYRSQQQFSTNASLQTDPVQKALATATSNLAKQQATTNATISSYGQVKSGFTRVEASAETLAATKSTTTTADVKKTLESFVSAYNDTLSAAAKTEPGNVKVEGYALRRSIGSDSSRADLRSMGITQKADGSLSLDSKALDAALQSNGAGVRSAATRIGSQAEKLASHALSDSGGVGSSLSKLTAKAQSLEARQTDLSNLSSAAQAFQQQSTQSTSSQSGINSYLQVLSL